jgi:hypothetical protein
LKNKTMIFAWKIRAKYALDICLKKANLADNRYGELRALVNKNKAHYQ